MNDNCIFCRIARGEIPAARLYEDEDILAFRDIAPQAPVHFLVIPRRHIPDLMSVQIEDAALLGKMVFTAQELAISEGLGKAGGRFVINCRQDGGQTVGHLHLHVLGGRALGWPPG